MSKTPSVASLVDFFVLTAVVENPRRNHVDSHGDRDDLLRHMARLDFSLVSHLCLGEARREMDVQQMSSHSPLSTCSAFVRPEFFRSSAKACLFPSTHTHGSFARDKKRDDVSDKQFLSSFLNSSCRFLRKISSRSVPSLSLSLRVCQYSLVRKR